MPVLREQTVGIRGERFELVAVYPSLHKEHAFEESNILNLIGG